MRVKMIIFVIVMMHFVVSVVAQMGWIVGKQGSYITQLSRKSGAHISISESTSREFGIVWKYVQITGSGRAVDRAKKLLHIRLDRLDPKNAPSISEEQEDLVEPSPEGAVIEGDGSK